MEAPSPKMLFRRIRGRIVPVRASRGHLDLNSERMVMGKVQGRIVPVRISVHERLFDSVKHAIAPSITAGLVTQAIAGAKTKSIAGAVGKFASGSGLRTIAGIAAGGVAFSVGYAMVFGARQKHVIELAKKKRESKLRIWLASKPAVGGSHNFGEHSYLNVRDEHGQATTYGGQIKNAREYGRSGVGLVRNFRTDKVGRATNIHDLTPTKRAATIDAIRRIHKNADKLGEQLKNGEYRYSAVPQGRKRTYNSNSVVGTIVRRANLDFHYRESRHNLPGFDRSIPKG